ncbi:membrane protein [Salmonella enterica subsp. enterica]|uniref:Membrane protein n=1 Tax=Salmonella enterica I TaxID=59201 RepID=A0A3S5DCS4_SALET|nr:membrane protein [Salmonella enterica subsp. enterica]
MPTNTLDKIRHSLSCVAVLFGLLGIFVFASFSPSYAWLYLGRSGCGLLYIVLFFVYAIAAWSIYSKYYPFLSLGRLSFVECFFPALALVCLTVLYNALGPGTPWNGRVIKAIFSS